MKKALYIGLIVTAFCMVVASCKKDDPAPTTPTTNDPVIACSGGNLCFNLDCLVLKKVYSKTVNNGQNDQRKRP